MASSDRKRIRQAFLTSLTEGVIELHRDWKAAWQPPIFLENEPAGALSLFPLPAAEFAAESGYYVEDSGKVVFVFFPDLYSKIEYMGMSIYLAGSFNGWQEAVGQEEWQLAPEKVVGREALVLRVGIGRLACEEACHFKFVSEEHHWFRVDSSAPNATQGGMGDWNYVFQPKLTGRHRLGFRLKRPIELSDNNYLVYQTRKDDERLCLQPGEFFFSLQADGPLGATVDGTSTSFRLFAPRARWVKVGFFEDLAQPQKISWLLMKRGEDFVWEASVDQDLSGFYYWYRLDGPKNEFSLFDPEFDILDPYARATVSRVGPGIVVSGEGPGKTPPSFESPQWQDLVLLEGHVRDFVEKAPGLRRDEDRPAGFADLAAYARRDDFYPKLLGVNAIELQPIQENDSQSHDEYHWGYMTANFFAPHSGYGSQPELGSQVAEFKELVTTLHEQGFAVVLDVVYNHVGEPAHLMFIDKLYYFRQGADGSLSNWSGCGNDFRTESPMALRIVVDSLKWLVEVYGVDGFRFDLADLVGKPALREIERELKAIRPDVILIAEPWSFRGHIGPELRDTGYASWNDGYREFLKGYARAESGIDAAKYYLTGSPEHYATWPAQTVNYVESHDDRVWIDEITENAGFDGTYPTPNDIARTRLMIAFLAMSVGMPMLHAGMDFLGTKNGVRNTYQDGPRNALDYARARRYPSCVRYFADWVAFRRSERGRLLRPYSRASEGFFEFLPHENGVSFACIYNASGESGPSKLLFAANPGGQDVEIDLGAWGATAWTQLADHEAFLSPSSRTWSNRPDKTLFLPGIACGLWESAL